MRTDHLTLEELERHAYVMGSTFAARIGGALDRDADALADARDDGYQEGYDTGHEEGFEAGFAEGEESVGD